MSTKWYLCLYMYPFIHLLLLWTFSKRMRDRPWVSDDAFWSEQMKILFLYTQNCKLTRFKTISIYFRFINIKFKTVSGMKYFLYRESKNRSIKKLIMCWERLTDVWPSLLIKRKGLLNRLDTDLPFPGRTPAAVWYTYSTYLTLVIFC